MSEMRRPLDFGLGSICLTSTYMNVGRQKIFHKIPELLNIYFLSSVYLCLFSFVCIQYIGFAYCFIAYLHVAQMLQCRESRISVQYCHSQCVLHANLCAEFIVLNRRIDCLSTCLQWRIYMCLRVFSEIC